MNADGVPVWTPSSGGSEVFGGSEMYGGNDVYTVGVILRSRWESEYAVGVK